MSVPPAGGLITEFERYIAQRRKEEAGPAERVVGLSALLEKAKLGGRLAEAEAWCADEGIDSVPYLRLAEMEDEFVAALQLKRAQATVLAKLLREVPASAEAPAEEARFTVKLTRPSEPSERLSERPRLGV